MRWMTIMIVIMTPLEESLRVARLGQRPARSYRLSPG